MAAAATEAAVRTELLLRAGIQFDENIPETVSDIEINGLTPEARMTIISRVPALSVQELLDCDKEFDRGCSGGAPAFAFAYIRSFGLSTWDSYPFISDYQAPIKENSLGSVSMVTYLSFADT